MDGGPPPPPPPHGANPKTTGGSHAPGAGSGLPPGNYDIFIIPPHSSGGGFIYLPSLAVQRTSFFVGVACTIVAFLVWKTIEPYAKQYFLLFNQSVSTGGNGVILLVVIMGALGWATGQMQAGRRFGGKNDTNKPQGASEAGPDANTGSDPRSSGSGQGSGYQRAPPNSGFPGADGSSSNGTKGSWNGYSQYGSSSPPPSSKTPWDEEEEQAQEQQRQAEEKQKKEAEEKRKQEEEEEERKRKEEEEERERRLQAERKQAEETKRKQEEERKRREEEERRQVEEERRRKDEEERRRKDEEERQRAWDELKRAEEARRQREEEERIKAEEKAKQEAAKQARAQAEKEKWEKKRQRERETREREARERIAKERERKAQEEKERRAAELAAKEAEAKAREAEARVKIEKEIRDKLEAEQQAKAVQEAVRRAAEEKAAAEAAAAKAKLEAEAAAERARVETENAELKAKLDAERAERLKAARERAQREREARLKAEADKTKAEAAAAAIPDITSRRSTTYGGIGGGERLDPYAGAKKTSTPSVTSTQSSPIKATVTSKKTYEKPSAKSYLGTEDVHGHSNQRDESQCSESSYAPSQSTTRTSPPASQRGLYSTSDPAKIVIQAVYLFNDLFPKPVAQLVSGVGKVTDGLILKIQSEGLFIDDDVRGIPQREWDVKAWTLKLVETGKQPSKGLHILRASVRDADGKKYVFLIDESESWKLAVGLQKLRKGSQVRSLQNSQMAPNEILRVLNSVPPPPPASAPIGSF